MGSDIILSWLPTTTRVTSVISKVICEWIVYLTNTMYNTILYSFLFDYHCYQAPLLQYQLKYSAIVLLLLVMMIWVTQSLQQHSVCIDLTNVIDYNTMSIMSTQYEYSHTCFHRYNTNIPSKSQYAETWSPFHWTRLHTRIELPFLIHSRSYRTPSLFFCRRLKNSVSVLLSAILFTQI